MNKGLVDKLVDSTKDWIDTMDALDYNDASDDETMYNSDLDTREVLRDLTHYEYFEVLDEVHNRLSTDWGNDF